MDLNAIYKSLACPQATPFRKPAWLAKSYSDPLSFWNGLLDAQDKLFSWPRKSRLFKSYDFFHDIIVRNRKNEAPALRIYDGGWQDHSYASLGKRAAQAARYWENQGVLSGDCVCLIHPIGCELVISLLAALKIGLIISMLPPGAKRFLDRRLQMLQPDHISLNPAFTGTIPHWADRILDNSPDAGDDHLNVEASYAYSHGALFGRFFDPCSAATDLFKELTCDAAYLYPLRDGLIALNIVPGQICSMPGWYPMETQPALLLASLLNGGTYLHLDIEQIRKNPVVLDTPVHTMGVTRQLRDLLMEKPVESAQRWNFWLKDPSQAGDIDIWMEFVKKMGLENTLSGNLKWHAAGGGCALFSSRHRGEPHPYVLPSAGHLWSLGDGSDGQSIIGGAQGIYSFVHAGQDEAVEITPWMLMAHSDSWLYTGSVVNGRCARTYLFDDVLDSLEDLPYYCSLAAVPGPTANESVHIVLMVFTCGHPDVNQAEVIETIRQRIRVDVGEEWLPDQFRFFPLYPRLTAQGRIDHQWCRRQYLSGSLHRKSEDELFLNISIVRHQLFPKQQYLNGKELKHGNSG